MNLGNVAQPASFTGTASNRIILQRCIAPAAGTIESIQCWTKSYNASWSELIFVIVSDNAGAPGTLLGQSAAFFGLPDDAMGQRSATLAVPPTVTNAAAYWVGLQIEHDSNYVATEADVTSDAWIYNDAAGFGTIPSDFAGLGALVDETRFGFSATYVSIASIDTLADPIYLDGTAKTIATTGLGTLTSATIGGVAVAYSAPSGDGTITPAAWAEGVVGLLLGSSRAVVVGDGTNTATVNRDISPPATRSWVALTSVATTPGCLGAYVGGLAIGDQITFDLPATLGVTNNSIAADSGIITDYIGSQTILIRSVSSGMVSAYTLTTGAAITVTRRVKLHGLGLGLGL